MTSPTNWPALLGLLGQARTKVNGTDPEHLQPNTFPRLKATEEDIAEFERETGERVPSEYRDFLLHANGWSQFEYELDLFGLEELRGGGAWNLAIETLEMYEDNDVLEASGVELTDIVPVGAGVGMSTTYALIREGRPGAGTVLWFSTGAEVDRFIGFAEFMASQIAYTERRLAKLLSRDA